MSDLISRAEAVDVLSLGKEILSRVLDDIDVVSTDREKYSWGLELIESIIKDIEDLPSAQPYTEEQLQKLQDMEQAQLEEAYKRGYEEGQGEIVLCKDCKHRPVDSEDTQGFGVEFPDEKCPCQCEDGWYNWRPDDEWFCANVERRTDEQIC